MADDPLMAGYIPLLPTVYGAKIPQDYPPRIHGLVPTKNEREISIQPTVPLNFGPIAPDQESPPFQVLILNRGYTPITLDNIDVVGDFKTTIPRERTIQPAGILALPIIFAPKRAGAHTGGLYVTVANAVGNRWLKLVGSTPA